MRYCLAVIRHGLVLESQLLELVAFSNFMNIGVNPTCWYPCQVITREFGKACTILCVQRKGVCESLVTPTINGLSSALPTPG